MKKINVGRYIVISILVFVEFFFIEQFQHTYFLGSSYSARSDLMRTQGIDIIALNVFGRLIYSFLFCYIFVMGYEGRGIREGLRFGIIISAFLWFPKMIFEYANMNLPGSWPLFWFLFGVISSIIGGVICAFIYRESSKSVQ